jgi:hypothetical protein
VGGGLVHVVARAAATSGDGGDPSGRCGGEDASTNSGETFGIHRHARQPIMTRPSNATGPLLRYRSKAHAAAAESVG